MPADASLALGIWVDDEGWLFFSVNCDLVRPWLSTVPDIFVHSSPLQNWQSIKMIVMRSTGNLPPSELFWMWAKSKSSDCEHRHGRKEAMRGGHQNRCPKIANYLLDVFILIHSDTDIRCLKTFPLHPQNWSHETKNWLLLVSFHSIGFQSAAITTIIYSLKSVSYSNMSADFCFSPSRVCVTLIIINNK